MPQSQYAWDHSTREIKKGENDAFRKQANLSFTMAHRGQGTPPPSPGRLDSEYQSRLQSPARQRASQSQSQSPARGSPARVPRSAGVGAGGGSPSPRTPSRTHARCARAPRRTPRTRLYACHRPLLTRRPLARASASSLPSPTVPPRTLELNGGARALEALCTATATSRAGPARI